MDIIVEISKQVASKIFGEKKEGFDCWKSEKNGLTSE